MWLVWVFYVCTPCRPAIGTFHMGLRWYLVSTAWFLVPGGIQMVLFPWFVAVYLNESPERVGIAQMAGQLPMVFLILWGGAIGDRLDQRKLLVGLHLAMAVPPLVLAAVVFWGEVRFSFLIGWVVAGAILGAFAVPARDALLTRVAGRDIQRVVTLTIGVQFGVQIVGFLVGSGADAVGPGVLLLAQAACQLLAGWTTMRIPDLGEMPPRAPSNLLADVLEGLRHAWASPVIRPIIFLTFAIGLFFGGAFMVALPLIVRDVFNGGAFEIALMFAANMLGTCVTIGILMRIGGIGRPGRAILLTGGVSIVTVVALSQPMPFWAFLGGCLAWGMCAGMSMTMSRSIVQEVAPEAFRARILSVYSLGLMSGMPVGSLVMGWCVAALGAQQAMLVPAVGMGAVYLLLGLCTALWRTSRDMPVSGQNGYT